MNFREVLSSNSHSRINRGMNNRLVSNRGSEMSHPIDMLTQSLTQSINQPADIPIVHATNDSQTGYRSVILLGQYVCLGRASHIKCNDSVRSQHPAFIKKSIIVDKIIHKQSG
jgi:hypothetical protein